MGIGRSQRCLLLVLALWSATYTWANASSDLILNGATWKYYSTGILPSSNWAALTYNDSGWSNGAAPLGYADAAIVTTLSYGGNATNKWATYYFRKTFDVTNAPGVEGLIATFIADDAAVIYLNGTRVYTATNLPASWSNGTYASPSVAEPYVPEEIMIDPALLITGTNVLAVELHQAGAASSDLYWELALKEGSAWTPYVLETNMNTLNLSQFPDAQLPSNHFSVLGYGFPNFSNEPCNPILKLLTIGHTHMGNDGAFPDSNVTANCHYSFESLPALASEAAEKILNEGQWITNYGSFSGLTNRGMDYSTITREGALKIGEYIYGLRNVSWSPTTDTWSRPTDNGSWIMMDEEQYAWLGGNYSQFNGWLMEGHALAAPDKRIGFYGNPVTWLFIADQNYQDMTDNEVENFILTEPTYAFDTNSWFTAAPYIDLSPGYFKIPYIETNSLYMKDGGGAYVTNASGSRVWRTDTFQEVIFGHTNTIWSEPEEDLRNFQVNAAGQGLVDPVLQPGYQWASWCGHYSNENWKTEVEMMVKGIYEYADNILISKLLMNKADFGDLDISYWRNARLKAYVERRPRTEPWTWGGNTRWIREVGSSGLKYGVMFAYLSGVQAVSTWDNGGFVSEASIKPYGSNVFSQAEFLPSIPNDDTTPRPDNYSRYVVWTAAVNTFARLMKGVPVDETLRYIRFYYPIVGGRNKEVISSGIYSGNKLIVMFNYPLLDPDESLRLKIMAGDFEYNTVLKGREVQLLNLTVPEGLQPRDFELHYVNIEGKSVHVNGFISASVAEHYTVADHSSTWTAYNDFAWSAGQTNHHISRISFVLNDADHGTSGTLIRFDTGEDSPVSMILSGGSGAEFSSTTVLPPNPGSPADTIFSGKVDMSRAMSIVENETGTITLNGMDPSRKYKVVVFGNRANSIYWTRKTILTLGGADSFTNTSSTGAVISGASNVTTTITTGTNTGGLVFIYNQIDPGIDGQIQFTVTGPPANKSYLNTLLVELLPEDIVDSDSDGMDDSWESSYFGGLSQSNGGTTQDWDNDGFDNYSEYRAGTDPTSAGSRLEMTTVSGTNAPGMVVLRWSSSSNKTYSILYGTNLLTPLNVLQSGLNATPPVNVYTSPASTPRGYLRIKLE